MYYVSGLFGKALLLFEFLPNRTWTHDSKYTNEIKVHHWIATWMLYSLTQTHCDCQDAERCVWRQEHLLENSAWEHCTTTKLLIITQNWCLDTCSTWHEDKGCLKLSNYHVWAFKNVFNQFDNKTLYNNSLNGSKTDHDAHMLNHSLDTFKHETGFAIQPSFKIKVGYSQKST